MFRPWLAPPPGAHNYRRAARPPASRVGRRRRSRGAAVTSRVTIYIAAYSIGDGVDIVIVIDDVRTAAAGTYHVARDYRNLFLGLNYSYI